MRALSMLAGLYLLYALIGVWLHPSFIYPFVQGEMWDTRYQAARFDSAAGEVLLYQANAGADGPVVLFFMGNVGALVRFPAAMALHADAGRHLVAMTYPGGGGVPGAPGERDLKARALATYDWVAAQGAGPVIVHGFSMGTGLALHVAARRDVQAVVLDAPFHRMCEQMGRQSYLPACWLPGVQRWDNAADAAAVAAPVLIHQGADDRLVLPDDARRLADRMTAAEVTFVLMPGVDHNVIYADPQHGPAVNAFIAAQK